MSQNRAARTITGADHMPPTKDVLSKPGSSNLKGVRKITKGMTPGASCKKT